MPWRLNTYPEIGRIPFVFGRFRGISGLGANFTVTDSSFGSLQGSVVIGIDDFGTALQSYGTLVPTPSTCASKGKAWPCRGCL